MVADVQGSTLKEFQEAVSGMANHPCLELRSSLRCMIPKLDQIIWRASLILQTVVKKAPSPLGNATLSDSEEEGRTEGMATEASDQGEMG
jgi:hypothetical protein